MNDSLSNPYAFLADWPLLGSLLQVQHDGISFLEALPILQNGILACLLCATLAGLLGVHVILRRIVFVSAAVSQLASLGIALALWAMTLTGALSAFELGAEVPGLFSPAGLAGIAMAFGSGILFAFKGREQRLTRESVLGLVYILPAMLTLMILHGISKETHLIDNILYGNTVMVASQQIPPLLILLVVVGGLHQLYFKSLIAVAFDPDVAAASGLPVTGLEQLFYAMLSLTVAFSIHAIGALPVFGFLVVPAAAALLFTQRYGRAVICSVLISVFSAITGFYLSFIYDLPTGPSMLICAALFLIPALGWHGLRRFV